MPAGLFLSASRPEIGVFESQVLEVGNLLRGIGLDLRYLLFEGVRTWWSSRKVIARRLAELGHRHDLLLAMHFVPSPLSTLGLALAAHLTSRSAGGLPRPLLLQARGPVAACVALRARRRLDHAVVLYDCRGDSAAEAELSGRVASTSRERRRWLRRARRLEELERTACRGADHVITVSEPLRRRVCELAGIPPAKTSVIPCCIDADRFRRPQETRHALRRRLGLDDRFVLVYSGSLGPYQVPEVLRDLFSAVASRLPNAHLLVVSQDREQASRVFGTLSATGRCTVVTAAYHEVPDYLIAADAALLLRRRDPVNAVACPVKFAEYLASGLPVIATEGIGDIPAYLDETGHGLLIEIEDDLDESGERLAAALRDPPWPRTGEAIRTQAFERFSRSAYLSSYRAILGDLGIDTHSP